MEKTTTFADSIKQLITDWLEDVISQVSSNFENLKSTYETLEEFESLVSEELSEILSDASKNKLLKGKKIDDSLDIFSELRSLFDENSQQDETNF